MSTGHYLVLTTCPHEEAARGLAESLLRDRLAACVSIVPGLRSVYRWQGRVEEAGELLLLIKTTQACYPLLEQRIRSEHPYELPEVLAVDLAAGSAGYLAWVGDNCRPDPA